MIKTIYKETLHEIKGATKDIDTTVNHFVKYCMFLAPCKSRIMRELRSVLPLAGEAGLRRLKELCSSNDD